MCRWRVEQPISALINELQDTRVPQLLQLAAQRLIRRSAGGTRIGNNGLQFGIDQRLPREHWRAGLGDMPANGICDRFGAVPPRHRLDLLLGDDKLAAWQKPASASQSSAAPAARTKSAATHGRTG